MSQEPTRPQQPQDALLPPRYVNVPASLVYAAGHEPALLTLIRIMGPCCEPSPELAKGASVAILRACECSEAR